MLREAAGNPLALAGTAYRIAGQGTPTRDPGSGVGGAALTARLERAFATRTLGLPAATQTLLLIAAVDDGTDTAEILAAATAARGTEITAGDLAGALQAGLILR